MFPLQGNYLAKAGASKFLGLDLRKYSKKPLGLYFFLPRNETVQS